MSASAPSKSNAVRARNTVRFGVLSTVTLHIVGALVLFWIYWDGPKLDRLVPVLFFAAFQLIWMLPAMWIARRLGAPKAAKGMLYGVLATGLIQAAFFAWASY